MFPSQVGQVIFIPLKSGKLALPIMIVTATVYIISRLQNQIKIILSNLDTIEVTMNTKNYN